MSRLINNDLEKAKQFALQNGASKIVRQLMQESECSVQELAHVLGIKPQSLSTKLYRDRFTFHEFQMILDLLDFKVAVLNKNNGKRVY